MLSDTLFPFERNPLGVTCDQNHQQPHEIAPSTFYERTAALAPGQPEPAGWPYTIQVSFCANKDADQREIVQHGPHPIVLYRVAKDARDPRLSSLSKKQVCWVVVEGSKITNDWDGQLITEEKAAELRKLKAPSKGAVFNRTSGVLTVNGKPLGRLEGADKYLLTLLVEKGAASFSDLKIAHDRPDKRLKALRLTYPKLKKHIHLPGGPGKGGYSTTISLEE